MKIRKLAALALAVATCWCAGATGLVPLPVSVRETKSLFRFGSAATVYVLDPQLKPLADYLAGYLTPVRVVRPQGDLYKRLELTGYISLGLLPEGDTLPAEGYRLRVLPDAVVIEGRDYAGVFNGIQTLLQLLPPRALAGNFPVSGVCLSGLEITDYPRFSYRGMMLDVARTFVPIEDVMRFIDNLSHHKINRFHWHLSDDEGWRVEIKSCPELARVGGFRGGDSPVWPIYGHWDEKYGGYYTQEEIARTVEYARVRNVEIIPEIDLPGHSRTAGKVYPEILCANPRVNTAQTAGYDRRNVWCATREENYALLDKILGEVCALFPSEYIHIGGDEVEMDQWSDCPHCKAKMEAEGWTDGIRLEGYFMARVTEILARHGKRPAVWNEAMEGGGLDPGARVHGWENRKAGLEAAAAGYRTVLMPNEYFYFDMKQSPLEPGLTWAGVVSAEKNYSFDPAREGFTAAQMECVEGVEATFWSELYASQEHDYLDYQTYPRICSLSEVAWTPQPRRDWADFSRRLSTAHLARLEALGIRYRTPPHTTPVRRITPQVSFSSSIRESTSNPYSNIERYRHYARTAVSCRPGDWFLYSFAAPVDCRSIELITGYDFLPRGIVTRGRVEVSYDGVRFERAGVLEKGRITVRPSAPVRALRIVSECTGNGETHVILYPPRVEPR